VLARPLRTPVARLGAIGGGAVRSRLSDTTELIQSEGDWVSQFMAILDGAARYAAASAGWMSQAACQGEDPELFFPIAATGPALQQISAAKLVCAGCAVRAMCLSYGVETSQAGIWGGTTSEERLAMRESSRRSARERSDRQADPARCGRPAQQSGRAPNAELAMCGGAAAAPDMASAVANPAAGSGRSAAVRSG